MAGSFTNPGDGSIIVTFEYQAELDKVEEAINKAGELWYNELYAQYDYTDPDFPVIIPWDNLTNQEKLGVVDIHLKKTLIDAARQTITQEAVHTAIETASSDDSIDLG